MKRSTLLYILVGVMLVFTFLTPLRTCQGRNADVSMRPQDREQVARLAAWASSAWRSPAEEVIRSFDSREVVFLGEFYKIREHALLVRDLLPALRDAGVYTLAIEYALSESQADIDALLAAPSWDEAKARRVTFTWVVTWGFQEYIDLYRAAWQLNRGLAQGERPMRILALGVRQNWELVKTERDLRDKETLHAILANGIPDEHMAKIIQREVLDRGEQALVYCNLQHAFTRYRVTDFEKNMRESGFAETRRAGAILYDRVGDRVATLALHAPWPDGTQPTGVTWPLGGTIDAMLAALPADRQAGGWDTAGTPLGDLPITSGSYAAGHEGLTLADLCDGYVATGPLTTLHAATAIAEFVPADAADYAVKNFPGPKPANLDAAAVNAAIAEEARALEQALRRFK